MFLGIDIGTSGVKAIVLDPDGLVVAQASAPLSVQRPKDLWSEQNPDAWIGALNASVLAIDPKLRAAVRGIGLAGQMHGATVLGADDRPLRPAILWNDGRSFAECEQLEAACPALCEITGNRAMPGFTAPKLMWLARHEPDVFARAKSVLLPKDYVRFALTGDKVSDMSDSAGTLWLDVARRTWSDALLAATGMTVEQMPRLCEGSEISSTLSPDIARRWGMNLVPVAGGGGDNAAGAVGVGVVGDGDALVSLGTSGVIFVANDRFRPNPARGVHSFCHALPNTWHQMAVHLSAASCIDWIGRIIGADPATVIERAQITGPGGGPEIFLPYLSGERTPHNDPYVRGAFLSLDHDSDGSRLAQAVLEGVAFALGDGLDALTEAGSVINRLAVIGGGAKSSYWGELLASVLGVTLTYSAGGDVGPSLGAARLAQLAVDGGDVATVCTPPPIVSTIDPNPRIAEHLAEKRAAFRAAYSRISSRSS